MIVAFRKSDGQAGHWGQGAGLDPAAGGAGQEEEEGCRKST